MHMFSIAMLSTLCAFTTQSADASSEVATSGGVDIHTQDVDLFYRMNDAANGHPTSDQIQHGYLDVGSEGLHTFLRIRNTTSQRIAKAIEEQPQLYVEARRCAAVLPAARPRLASVLVRFREIYPAAKSPPITFLIGRGKPIGVGSPVDGLQIGLEALCGVKYYSPNLEDRFIYVVAHEYIHVQQRRELVDDDNNWTVLEGSLVEGAADFVGEQISAGLANPQPALEAKGREKMIETQFVADKDKHDLSHWLDNGSMERSGNMGYWVGYNQDRIKVSLGSRSPMEYRAELGYAT